MALNKGKLPPVQSDDSALCFSLDASEEASRLGKSAGSLAGSLAAAAVEEGSVCSIALDSESTSTLPPILRHVVEESTLSDPSIEGTMPLATEMKLVVGVVYGVLCSASVDDAVM